MSDFEGKGCGTTFLFILCVFCGLVCGECSGRKAIMKQAVLMGYAHYVPNEKGEVMWEWIPPRIEQTNQINRVVEAADNKTCTE